MAKTLVYAELLENLYLAQKLLYEITVACLTTKPVTGKQKRRSVGMVENNLMMKAGNKDASLRTSLRLQLAMGVLFLGYVLVMFHRFSIAIMADRLMVDLHLNVAQLSVLTAVYFYPYAFMQFPVGLIADRIGPKRLVTAMLFLTAAASVAFGLASSFPLALVSRLLIGLSVSCVFVPTEKFIATFFPPEKFSTLTSYLFIFGIIGALAASAPLAYLVNYLGWRQVYIVIGIVAGVLGMGTWFLLIDEQKRISGGNRLKQEGLGNSLKQVLSEWGLWPVVMRSFLGYGASATFQSLWAGPYLIAIVGVDRITAGYLIMLLSLGQLVILPFSGFLTDRVFRSRKIPLLVSSFGSILFWLPFAFLPDKLTPVHIALLFTFNALLAGLGSGPFFTQLKELYPVRLAGTAFGIGNFFNMAGPAVIPLVIGAAMAGRTPGTGVLNTEAFTLGFRYLLAANLIGTVVYLFSKDTSPNVMAAK